MIEFLKEVGKELNSLLKKAEEDVELESYEEAVIRCKGKSLPKRFYKNQQRSLLAFAQFHFSGLESEDVKRHLNKEIDFRDLIKNIPVHIDLRIQFPKTYMQWDVKVAYDFKDENVERKAKALSRYVIEGYMDATISKNKTIDCFCTIWKGTVETGIVNKNIRELFFIPISSIHVVNQNLFKGRFLSIKKNNKWLIKKSQNQFPLNPKADETIKDL